MSFCTGNSFRFFDAGTTAHLYVIIAQDAEPPSQCLAVNVTTIRNGPYDKSCILEPGDHACIKNRSWIFYRQAAIWQVAVLNRKLRSGDIWQDRDNLFDWKILKRIQEGALQSDQMAHINKDFLRKHLGI